MSYVFAFNIDDNIVLKYSDKKDLTQIISIDAMQQALNHIVGNKKCNIHNKPPQIALVFPSKIETVNYSVGECCCQEFADEIRNIVSQNK